MNDDTTDTTSDSGFEAGGSGGSGEDDSGSGGDTEAVGELATRSLGGEFFKLAFRQTANPALVTDESLTIVDVNDAGLAFTEYGRDQLEGESPMKLVADPLVFEEILDSLVDGEAWSGDLEIVTRTGAHVFGRGSATPVVIDGEICGYVASFVDATAQRRYEETLHILNRVLRHNLRNDVNVIAGALESLDVDDRDEEATEALAMARRRLDAMVERANTARQLNSLFEERGDRSLEPTPVDGELEHALADVEESVDVDWSGTELPVVADDLLHLAFHAVIDNAVVHNDKADPHVSVWVESGDDRVTVCVGDNGPGIDQGQVESVLGRLEGSQVRHGQGLSLFFVDRLVELYGGEVRVRENSPEGSVFELHLRRAVD